MKFSLFLAFLLNLQLCFAQGTELDGKQIVGEGKERISSIEQRRERLYRFRKELIVLTEEIKTLEKELSSNIDMVSRIQKEARLAKIKKEYSDSKYKFIQTITDIDLSQPLGTNKQTSFSDDIKQILDPVLQTFKKIAQKPREIQELNEEKEKIESRLADAKNALARLKTFSKDISTDKTLADLKYKVASSQKKVKQIVDELSQKQEDITFDLNHIEEHEESIVTTFSSIIFDFITTKGKNLVLALLIFSIIYWLFRYGQEKVISLMLFKVSDSDHKDFYDWLVRPTRVIYSVFSFLIAFFTAILTLYVLNDWVLVTIILFTFAALIWSSKQYFPLFFEQSKIVLNLGAVREGERLIYNGIPWVIESLGYYCRLVNPELEGGSLRINTKELLNANSRKVNPKEPWFPCKTGDWVEAKDLFGKVVLQTPDQVVIESIGGERKYLATADFFSLQPKNLTEGFCVDFPFGFDYQHQKILFEQVIPAIQSHIDQRVVEDYPQVKQCLKKGSVEFLQAGAHSLDIRVFYKFSGEIAQLKPALIRSMQKYVVEVCNAQGFVIPFNQMTVHMQS